ncbi:MAG: ferritin-like domain-containing protein, partial [Bacillota bacterium]|nr:ferritin-like domain-containing protein [Bacillota bacterium]
MYYYPPAAAQMPGSNHPTGNTQIPQMPILGYNNFPQLIQYIYKAIIGEATAVDFYSRLLKDAPDEISRDFIEEALNDEKKHLNAFLKLYKHF